MLRETTVGETGQISKLGVFWVSEKQNNNFVLEVRKNGRIVKTTLIHKEG